MKKTLKILMAIILFAVVLTIATSVNAATLKHAGDTTDPYDDIVAAANGEAGVAVEADRLVKRDGNIFTVQNAVVLKDLNAPDGAVIIVDANLEINNAVVITNTVTIADGNGALSIPKGMTINKSGTLYTDLAALIATNYGKVFSEKAFSLANNTSLTLKEDSVTGLPAKGNKNTVYAYLSVPTTDVVGANSKIAIDFKVTVPGETAMAKIESGKEYVYDVDVKWGSYVLEKSEVTSVVPYAKADKIANIDAGSVEGTPTNGKGEIKIPTGLESGSKIYLTVTVAGEEKTVELTVGTAPVDQNKQEQPAEPTKPADTNKGELDDSPKTGDHIIPAATLLAVVVVANVVYFAKSKNN